MGRAVWDELQPKKIQRKKIIIKKKSISSPSFLHLLLISLLSSRLFLFHPPSSHPCLRFLLHFTLFFFTFVKSRSVLYHVLSSLTSPVTMCLCICLSSLFLLLPFYFLKKIGQYSCTCRPLSAQDADGWRGREHVGWLFSDGGSVLPWEELLRTHLILPNFSFLGGEYLT